MAKFFYNRVYNTKRTIINIVIIGICIIGIIICFFVTSNSNLQGESHLSGNANITYNPDVTIEINEKFSNTIFFSELENVDLEDIDIVFPEDFDVSVIGTYIVTITIDGEKYYSNLNVIDTTRPELVLQKVSIKSGNTYKASDFVVSCTDNSNEECIIDFYEGTDEDGNPVDYSAYTKEGTYSIKITATDSSGNQAIKETTLTISSSTSSNLPTTTTPTCKYGNNEYDTDEYLVAVDVTSSGCAISLDLYKNETTVAGINSLMDTETTRIKKDVEALNLTGTFGLNRNVTAVVNTAGSGIVGYQLEIIVTVTNNGEITTVAEYKVDGDGNRVFTTNPYNLNS